MPQKNHISAWLLGPIGHYARPAVLLAIYLVQITLTGWLHLDDVAGRCDQCRRVAGPTITTSCEGSDSCHLPSHHHHPIRHHHDEHLGCSLCSPLQSFPTERPLMIAAAQGVALISPPIEGTLPTPRLLPHRLPRGPPASAPFAG